ncbi:RagB/SusD family nutrient uptake outer membrane protein [Terrimonas sp. NA20]|uniref:RagB/SusD family nutrient uptake outer membrane protein n=1 Tax=Terrimonas ginsenosidimutans TaxID=2908004 RepID=A0ABS9KT53_9BACT|nr:RagB/SusD family nutrient uptake outer membrane protein [Terrimonas ginsenosidimutans]MCG2615475.1 RagB/SusD family nutrient uptake outer membrane protein [Terrimonas ginsenosidimutans]
MKLNSIKNSWKVWMTAGLAAIIFTQSACRKNLLDQNPTTVVDASTFWKSESDATTALVGAYASVAPLFTRDYFWEGNGDYIEVRGSGTHATDVRQGAAFNSSYDYKPTGNGAGSDKMYQYLFGGVNRTNYVIENVQKMLPHASAASLPGLEAVVGEARLLRGLVYFRLISLWGDVPYIDHIITSATEADTMTRMPIAQIKDRIIEDFTYAFEKLPATAPMLGRAAKPAALALRGKMHLYWACWNKNGWPELAGFTPDAAAATASYQAAEADFKSVINDYGLTLFRNGEPGQIDALGKADILPNYYHLFMPIANGDKEMVFSFTHGGINTALGEELMRDFGGRTQEFGQCWLSPRFEIADRYQSIVTGDYMPKLIPINPATPGARTLPNSAINPQSYANRDYRMKSTILWDNEMIIGLASLKSTGYAPYIYKTWGGNVTIGGVNYITYLTDGTTSGYVFRKFVRNYPGQGRSEGDYSWPVVRLADVFLMYAEATNELNGPQADAIALVNRIRHRGNLPALAADKVADKNAFFNAIEQERIIELVGEGQRSYDIRRWRALSRIYGPPGGPGVQTKDTHNENQELLFQNTQERGYEQYYIFRIPPSERNRNQRLTQNTPWL